MPRESRLYVGNLPNDITKREIDDLFYKFGRVRDIMIRSDKLSNNTAFAFITFDDDRDAREAIRRRDRYSYDRRSLKVEWAKEDRGRGGKSRSRSRGRSRSRSRDRSGDGRSKKSRSRSSEPKIKNKEKIRSLRTLAKKNLANGILLNNLPSKGSSWSAIKDFGRLADPDVAFADYFGSGEGILTFQTAAAFEKALDVLPKTEFLGETVTITRVADDERFAKYFEKAPKDKDASSSSEGVSAAGGGPSSRSKDDGEIADRGRSRSRSRSNDRRSSSRNRSASREN